ncbi:polysaccharide lyase [Arcticibacter svalbardensis]|nr:polysaccharide lyase [Arcticibacter svalbardensis]
MLKHISLRLGILIIYNFEFHNGATFHIKEQDLTYIKPHKTISNNTSYFRSHLIFETSFESIAYLSIWKAQEKQSKFSIQRSNTVSKVGKYSLKVTLKRDDKIIANGKRAELVLKPETDPKSERWYGFTIFFPDSYILDNEPESVMQLHDYPDFDLGENWRSPPISLQTRNGHLYLVILWSRTIVNTSPEGKKEIDLGLYHKKSWNDIVFHIIPSWENDGIIEVWKNSKFITQYKGPNVYNDRIGTYFKLGLYKWTWMLKKEKKMVGINKRIIYYDEVRIGDNKASYKDVAPGKM